MAVQNGKAMVIEVKHAVVVKNTLFPEKQLCWLLGSSVLKIGIFSMI